MKSLAHIAAEKAENFDGSRNKAEINKVFRLKDQSHLYPVRNKFDVTERAIRRVRARQENQYGLEYALALEAEISEIVNSLP